MDVSELDELVPTATAASYVGVGTSTVRQWASRGYVNQEGKRTKLEPSGLDERGHPLYRLIDVLRAARDTARSAVGARRIA